MNPADAPWLVTGLYNGTEVAAAGLQLPALGPGFTGGEGIYETVRVRHGRAQLIGVHGARLTASLSLLGAVPALAGEGLPARCVRVIAANGLTDGNLKIFMFKDAAGWSELILARAVNYAAERYAAGFRLQTAVCALRTDPLFAVKSLANQNNARAKRGAIAAGFDEALFVDPQGRVLEGASTNLFVVKEGAVGTPPLDGTILPGVMRGCVLRLGPVRERAITLDELLQADEVFVTNALLGIMPVAQVDATAFALSRNPVTRAWMAALAEGAGDGQ